MSLKQLHPTIRIRILTVFMTRTIEAMIFPFMAIYFSEKLGEKTAGLLMVLLIVLRIAASFWGGYLADRYGRKKVLLYAEGVLFMAAVLMAAANSPWIDSVWLTFAMVMLHGAANGIGAPAADAMLIDVSTPETRTLMYSINYWAINLSITLGTAIGGWMFKEYRFELFMVMALVSLCILLLTAFRVKETYQPRPVQGKRGMVFGGAARMLQTYQSVYKDKRFMAYSLGMLLLLSTEFHLTQYIGVRLEREFVPLTVDLPFLPVLELQGIHMFGLIQMENTILIVVTALGINALLKRYDQPWQRVRWLTLGSVAYVAGFAVIAYTNEPLLLVLFMLLATVGELIHTPLRQRELAEMVSVEARSSYMAVNGMMMQGARMIAALGITVGAFLPSAGMAWLIFAIGMTGTLLIRRVVAKPLREFSQPEKTMRKYGT